MKENLSVITATAANADSVYRLFDQNKDALRAESISLREWEELLSSIDPDEAHFLICKDSLPVAYVKLNGLENKREAWVSMLFVAKEFQRRGIGSFAVNFAERYLRERGFEAIKIQTDTDNIQAVSCYTKCGYEITDTGNKVRFRKKL